MIQKVRAVFEGEFKPGILPPKTTGRLCDGFVLFLCGGAEYVFEGERFSAGPRDLLYLAKDSIYEIRIQEKSKFICIDFSFFPQETAGRSCVFPGVSPDVKHAFQKIFYIWNKKDPWHIPQALGIVYDLYAEGLRAGNKGRIGQGEQFARIAAFVLEQYTRPDFSVEEIAKYAGISQVHVRRLFQSAVKTAPVRYVNFLRLEKAKNMLLSSNFTVTEIALSVGFADPYYFSRLFKKEVGICPQEYRRKDEKNRMA